MEVGELLRFSILTLASTKFIALSWSIMLSLVLSKKQSDVDWKQNSTILLFCQILIWGFVDLILSGVFACMLFYSDFLWSWSCVMYNSE